MAVLKIDNREYNVEVEFSKNNNFLDYENELGITKQFDLNFDDYLSSIFNLNIVDTTPDRIPAILQISEKVFVGTIKIESIAYDGLISKRATVTFISNLNFFETIKNKKCNELDMSYYNNWYRTDDVLHAVRNRLNVSNPNECYTYAIVNYDDKPIHRKRMFNTFHNSYDFTPVLKMKYLVERIAAEAGYSIKYNFDDTTDYYYRRLILNSTKLTKFKATTYEDNYPDSADFSIAERESLYVTHHNDYVNNNSFKVGKTATQSLTLLDSQASTPVTFGVTVSFPSDDSSNDFTSFRNTIGQAVGTFGVTYSTLRWDASNSYLYSGFDVVNQKLYLALDLYIPRYSRTTTVGTISTTHSIAIQNVSINVYRRKNGVTKMVEELPIFFNGTFWGAAIGLETANLNHFSYGVSNSSTDYRVNGVVEFDLTQYFNYNNASANEFSRQPLAHNYSGVLAGEEYLYFKMNGTFIKSGSPPNVPSPEIGRNSFFYNDVSPTYREGTLMNISKDLAPNVEQSKLFKNVLQLLNLKLSVDEQNKIVTLSSHDKFYENVLDISDYFSFDNVTVEYTPNSSFNRFAFQPKDAETTLSKNYKSQVGNSFGYSLFRLSETTDLEHKLELEFTYEVPFMVENEAVTNFIVPSSLPDEKLSIGLISNYEKDSYCGFTLSNNRTISIHTTNIFLSGLNDPEFGTSNNYTYYPSYLPFNNNINPTHTLLFDGNYSVSYPMADTLTTYLNSLHVGKLYSITNKQSRKIQVDIKIADNNKGLMNILTGEYNTVYIKQLMNNFYIDKYTYNDGANILRLELIKK